MKAILLDVDGVLFHNELFTEQYAKNFNISVEKMLPFFTGVFQQCLLGKKDLKEELETVKDDWGWSGRVEELLDWWFDHEKNVDEALLERMQFLRQQGIGCYLATNQEKYKIAFLKKYLQGKIDGVFASSTLGVKKKDPLFFEKVAETLSLPPQEITFYDDEEENVEAAKRVGVDAQLYTDITAVTTQLHQQ